MTNYIYQPISLHHNFRIIRLFGSSNPEATVRCTLLEKSLEEPYPEYEAISYCWNGQRATRSVLCDGKRLAVTPNCEAALRRFRPAAEGDIRFIWIDSICIDQTSTEERSGQVAIMGTIYSRAKRILVWLGAETDAGYAQHAATFEWLTKLGHAAKHDDAQLREQQLLKLAHELNTADLNEFVNGVPWFKRVWVIQEVALSTAAELVHGRLQASLSDILEARSLLGQMDKGDGTYKSGAGAASMALWNAFAVHDLGTHLLNVSRRSGGPSEIAVCNFMAEARFSGATNEKDKIFGLYNILTDSGIDLPPPDYAKSVGTIYREASAAMIKSTRSLRMLELVDGLGSTQELASWAPDWSSIKHSLGLGSGLGKEKLPDFPSSQSIFEFKNQDRHLHVKGVVVDEILSASHNAYMHVDERIGSPEDYNNWTKNPRPTDAWYRSMLASYPENSSDILRVWNVRVLMDFIALGLGCHPADASQHSVLALFRTFMSQIHQDIAEKDSTVAREWFQILYDGVVSRKERNNGSSQAHIAVGRRDSAYSGPLDVAWPRNRRYLPQFDNDSPVSAQLKRTPEYEVLKQIFANPSLDAFHSHIDRIRYKTIFTTTSGNIGIAPWSVHAGDKIVFISGLRIPMVIRQTGTQYRLRTQAHVEGLMHSKGWPEDVADLKEIVLV